MSSSEWFVSLCWYTHAWVRAAASSVQVGPVLLPCGIFPGTDPQFELRLQRLMLTSLLRAWALLNNQWSRVWIWQGQRPKFINVWGDWGNLKGDQVQNIICSGSTRPFVAASRQHGKLDRKSWITCFGGQGRPLKPQITRTRAENTMRSGIYLLRLIII